MYNIHSIYVNLNVLKSLLYIRFLARNRHRMQRYAKILNGKPLEYKNFLDLYPKTYFGQSD